MPSVPTAHVNDFALQGTDPGTQGQHHTDIGLRERVQEQMRTALIDRAMLPGLLLGRTGTP